MDNRILTKEEYAEKLNSLIKPMVDMAMDTQQFRETGCYSEEFITDGYKEISVMILNKYNWIAIKSDYFHDLFPYKSMYLQLTREHEELQEKLEKYEKRKRFFGIF